MKAADWNTIFEWIVSSWEEVNLSTLLNGFRVSFGEDDDVLEIEENEMNVNESDPNIAVFHDLVELLQNFTFIDNEKCDGFEECDVKN